MERGGAQVLALIRAHNMETPAGRRKVRACMESLWILHNYFIKRQERVDTGNPYALAAFWPSASATLSKMGSSVSTFVSWSKTMTRCGTFARANVCCWRWQEA